MAADGKTRSEKFPSGIASVGLGEVERQIPLDDPPPLAPNAALAVIGKPIPRHNGRANRLKQMPPGRTGFYPEPVGPSIPTDPVFAWPDHLSDPPAPHRRVFTARQNRSRPPKFTTETQRRATESRIDAAAARRVRTPSPRDRSGSSPCSASLRRD